MSAVPPDGEPEIDVELTRGVEVVTLGVQALLEIQPLLEGQPESGELDNLFQVAASLRQTAERVQTGAPQPGIVELFGQLEPLPGAGLGLGQFGLRRGDAGPRVPERKEGLTDQVSGDRALVCSACEKLPTFRHEP